MLSLPQIETLLDYRSISDRYPWATNNQETVEAFYRVVCQKISETTGGLCWVEWEPIVVGSYIDAWFYKKTAEFDVDKPLRYGEEHKGLAILLSLFSPYYVLLEGEKHWHPHGGGGYSPSLEDVDNIPTPAVAALGTKAQSVLNEYGLIRMSREDLSHPLPWRLKIDTLLTTRGDYTHFDALFNATD